jgi:hypothetical protein
LPPLFSPLVHAAAAPYFYTDAAAPSLSSCRPVASPPEHSSVVASSSQVLVVFARHPPHSRAALTTTAPAMRHPCHSARTHECKRTLERGSPPYPLPNAPLRLLLHAHARASFSSAAIAAELAPPPLRTTGVAAKGVNGSALAPRCFPAQPHCRSHSEPVAF